MKGLKKQKRHSCQVNEFIYEIIKYNNVRGVRDFALKKVQVSEKPKELKVLVAHDCFIHPVLSLLTV